MPRPIYPHVFLFGPFCVLFEGCLYGETSTLQGFVKGATLQI